MDQLSRSTIPGIWDVSTNIISQLSQHKMPPDLRTWRAPLVIDPIMLCVQDGQMLFCFIYHPTVGLFEFSIEFAITR